MCEKKFTFEPDYAVAPGETVREVMESLGMSQKELAMRLDTTVQNLNRIFNAEQRLTVEMANKLESLTGVPSSFWNNLESQYQVWGRTIDNVSEVILIVRQTESFGKTKWDFRFNRRNLSVAIADKEWFSRFQAGEIDIRPGDALHVQMKEIISYDANGEVVNEEREVVRVMDVIRKQK